jgi:hypothetical protein
MNTRLQDQYTQVQGHAVRYWTQGDTGSTVLLLHGISCSGIGQDTLFNFRLASIPFLGEVLTKPSLFGLGMIWKLAFHDTSFVTQAMLAEKLALAQLPNAQTVFLKTLRGFFGLWRFSRSAPQSFSCADSASALPQFGGVGQAR